MGHAAGELPERFHLLRIGELLVGALERRGRFLLGGCGALMMQPELILFDEPTAGLDPVISSVIDELIISLTVKTNTTSIIVTHEMESAFRVATRMAMLYQGKIIEDASPDRFRVSANPVVHQFVTGTTEGPITETPPNADSSE